MAQSSIIDAQVHAYERNHAGRPWIAALEGPPEVTGGDLVTAMQSVSVDGALLVSPLTQYGYDASYARLVYQQFPDRLGLIKPFNPEAVDVVEDIEQWAVLPGVVGARVLLDEEDAWDESHPGLDRICRATARCGLPLAMYAPGHLPIVAALARRHPDTQFVLDHLGILQPLTPPPPKEPFANLQSVIALSVFDNIVIKVTGVCTLSHQPFPFADIWPPLHEVFTHFGIDRCLWGTDWTRATNLLSYEEGVRTFTEAEQLTQSERNALMGGNLTRVYGWAPQRSANRLD